ITVPLQTDENKGPKLLFSDQTQSIYLADMSGDGLTDIVRIRNGEVCYWPNLGYGYFGAKVTMAHSPCFSDSVILNQQYIKLADIDGSGTTDIFYFGNGKAEFWYNQSGNSFSSRKELPVSLPVDSLTNLSLIDLLGNGTTAIVWSSPSPAASSVQMQYIELFTQKPYLLNKINNNLGAITTMHYASSTFFYLQDKLQGSPWVTKLPFPVQVLSSVVTEDCIANSRFCTKYRYHHGYYDQNEREFRGFGMVETIDTETFEQYEKHAIDPGIHYVAPIHTKTWYHNGAFLKQKKISGHFDHEYYCLDSKSFKLPDSQIENQQELSLEELRQACRALKGNPLRREIYEYSAPHPYQVIQTNFQVKTVQRRHTNKHAVFFTHAAETITYHYEQNPKDPRISHDFILAVDAYGNILSQCQIVYPRRAVPDILPEQTKGYATLMNNEYFNHPHTPAENFHLLGIPIEVTIYELGKNVPITQNSQVSIVDMKNMAASALTQVIPYATPFNETGIQARVQSRTITYFWDEEQKKPLPKGLATSIALVHHVEIAAFPTSLITSVFQTSLDETAIRSAGYIEQEEYYWNPGLTQHYSIGGFYLPTRTEDPLGGFVEVSYDAFRIAPQSTKDALENTVRCLIDYRTLSAWRTVDPNGNTQETITDPLGMVIATSVYGSELQKPCGDLPLFTTDNTPAYTIVQPSSSADILNNPLRYLQTASTYLFYDLFAYKNRKEPLHFIQLSREKHVHNLTSSEIPRIIKTIGYSDGFGRELQSKIMVEPGSAWIKQSDNTFHEQFCVTRFLVSGRKVYNNKEKPVKQYEPFYSGTHEYEPEEFFKKYGVTPVIHYDPLLRVIKTDTPKGFFSKVTFTPWVIYANDENDTVKESLYYSKILTLPPEEQQALRKAEAHHNTPQIVHLDTLGREFLIIENLADITDPQPEKILTTKTEFSITGTPQSITDPRQFDQTPVIKTFLYTYTMQDQPIQTTNIDAGVDRIFANISGNPVFSMDSRGHRISVTYDKLQRPVKTHVSNKNSNLDNTVEYLIYGENPEAPANANMRGQVWRHFDQAGFSEVTLYSFKAEPKETFRRIRSEYKNEANWTCTAADEALLDADIFTSILTYDSLGRVIQQNNPDGSITTPVYHESGKLKAISVKLKNETAFTPFVTNITYNPKSQRESIEYGNQTKTTYQYEKETFRLKHLTTRRLSDAKTLQDIAYTYDPVGNITQITDTSHTTIFNNNQQVEPKQTYTYDALYRLIEATGREHEKISSNKDFHRATDAFKQTAFIQPNDNQKLLNYIERYSYDKAGNLFQIKHISPSKNSGYTRDILIDQFTNRAVLKPENDKIILFSDFFDVNGNCINLDHLKEIQWNYRDNISKAVVIKRQNENDDAEYYVYDSQGNRVRKVTERVTDVQTGAMEIEEKVYLGSVEIKKIHQKRTATASSTIILQRSSLHAMDDTSRLALIHYWEMDSVLREVESNAEIKRNKLRYQYGNHLGSSSLEVDSTGKIISYEEYLPYGESAYVAGENAKEVKLKEYRYTGKERDDLSGLYYYGARYYAGWMGRWVSCDPVREKGDGINLFVFCTAKPIICVDADGKKTMRDDNFISDRKKDVEDNNHSLYRTDKDIFNEWSKKWISIHNRNVKIEENIKKDLFAKMDNIDLVDELINITLYETETSFLIDYQLARNNLNQSAAMIGYFDYALFWIENQVTKGKYPTFDDVSNAVNEKKDADTKGLYGFPIASFVYKLTCDYAVSNPKGAVNDFKVMSNNFRVMSNNFKKWVNYQVNKKTINNQQNIKKIDSERMLKPLNKPNDTSFADEYKFNGQTTKNREIIPADWDDILSNILRKYCNGDSE
ncbi:MAG: hypothetical protein JW795_08935, partial [Chitinivibrionales bacterium]|nr:hypothetical protein [Chitinivibrionales bacterium]